MDLQAVLGLLPATTLRTAVSSHLLSMVQRVDLFGEMSAGLVNALITRMEPAVYLPSDFVVTQGDQARSMDFLQQGEIQIVLTIVPQQAQTQQSGSSSAVVPMPLPRASLAGVVTVRTWARRARHSRFCARSVPATATASTV